MSSIHLSSSAQSRHIYIWENSCVGIYTHKGIVRYSKRRVMTSVVDFNNPGSYVTLVERADWTYGQNANMTKIPATVAKTYNVADIGFPDNTLSGIVMPPFTKVVLWDDLNGTGDFLTLDSGGSTLAIQDLRAYRGADNNPGQNFNDLTSSISVIPGATPAATVGCCTGTTPADQCGGYVPGSSNCTANMVQYCTSDKMNSPVCQAWCRANPGLCDAAAITYCKGAPSDPFCSCINSPLGTIPSVNPTCYDQTCLNKSGYRTAPMMSACPPISQVTCTQINNIAAGGKIDLNLFQFTQSCGNQTNVNTGQTGTTGGTTGSTGGTTGGTTGNTTTTSQQTLIAQQQAAAAQQQLMQQQAAYQQAMAQYQQQLAQWQQQQVAATNTPTGNTILGIAAWLFYTMIFIIIVVIGAIVGFVLIDDDDSPAVYNSIS